MADDPKDLDPKRQKVNALMKSIDEIKEVFGDNAIIPAYTLETSESDPHKERLSERTPEIVHSLLLEQEKTFVINAYHVEPVLFAIHHCANGISTLHL